MLCASAKLPPAAAAAEGAAAAADAVAGAAPPATAFDARSAAGIVRSDARGTVPADTCQTPYA